MFKWLKQWFKEHFSTPYTYARIAELLRAGHNTAMVDYGHGQVKYYTGSGNVCTSAFGKKIRYNVQVVKWQPTEHQGTTVNKWGEPIYVWQHWSELDRVLNTKTSDVVSIKPVEWNDTDATAEYLTRIASRLKPGQGYQFNGCFITQDLIAEDGYVLIKGGVRHIIPFNWIGMDYFRKWFDINAPFDPEKVFVVDESKIKRQHRKPTDPKRWLVVKQVPSIEDKWVFKFTHGKTAHGPVFYYSVEVDIDHKGMVAHPFYIHELLHVAVNDVKTNHGFGTIEINPDNVIIEWDGKAELLPTRLARVARYPLTNDVEPIVIYKPLETTYVFHHPKTIAFRELK